MRFHIQNLKLRNQIVLIVSIIFLLICAGSGVAFYHLSASSVTESFANSAEDAVRQMENTLETRLGIIEERSKSMLINNTFSSILAQYLGGPDTAVTVRALGVIGDYLKDFERGEELISSSYLYTEQGDFDNYIHIRRRDFVFRESPFYRVFEDGGTQSLYWLTPMEDLIFQENETVIPCVRRFTVQGYQGEWLYFVYQLDQERLRTLITGENAFFDDVVIVNQAGEKILGGNLAEPERLLALWGGGGEDGELVSANLELGGSDYLVESCAIGINGWKLFALKSRAELLGSLKRLAFDILKIAAIAMAVSVGLVVWISRRMTDGLSRLERQMSRVRRGDLTVRFIYPYQNEIGRLSEAFNYMVGEIEALVWKKEKAIEELRIERNRVEEVQKQKRKAELKALQAQINPHFLYNTLNAITWEAAESGMTDVGIMASSLGKFFRLSLSKGAEIITLAEEAEHVKSYLKIQGIRYKDKLDYRVEIPEGILECRILKLVLQPLAENAIYHGIKEKKEGGLIRIGASLEEADGVEAVVITVWDNGAGMAEEKTEEINRELAAGVRDSGQGYGIFNVNERIRIYYGDAYGLRYESREGEYTRAVLRIPARFAKEQADVQSDDRG